MDVPDDGVMPSDAPFLSVVVPSYRQGPVIAGNLREIVRSVEGLGHTFEVVLVSDGSPDDTEAQAIGVADRRVRVIAYDRNMGKGYALRTGSLAARGRWVAWVDSDLDLDPALLAGFIERGERDGLDVVVGSKRHPESVVDYPRRRRAYSWLYQQLVKVLFDLDIRDTQVGMKLFRREVLQEVLPVVVVKRYAFDLEILAVAHRFGVTRIAEAPIRLDYRFSGTGVNWRAIAQALWDTAAVFYRLRILDYYDRRRVLAHRIAVHRPPVAPTVTVVVTPGSPGADEAERLNGILGRLPREVPVVLVRPPGAAGPAPKTRALVVHPSGRSLAEDVAGVAAGCGTDLVAFIDLDSQPTRHWIDSATPLFGDPMVAAVAGPTVPLRTGDVRADAAGILTESRLGVAGARVRHHVGTVREVGEFPLRNLFVRTEVLGPLAADGTSLDDRLCTRITRRLGLSVISSPDVVVTTVPPPLFAPYLGRLFRLAQERGASRDPDAPLRLRHVVPAAFVAWLALAPLVLARPGRARRAWMGLALVYTVSITWFGAVVSALQRRPRLGAVAALGAAASHLAFGAGLILGRVGAGLRRSRGADR